MAMMAIASKILSLLSRALWPLNIAITKINKLAAAVTPVTHAPAPALPMTYPKNPTIASKPQISQEYICGLVLPAKVSLIYNQ